MISSNVTATENWPQGCIPKYDTDRGLCFSCRVPDYLHASEVKQINVYLQKPIKIYLHHPGQFLSWQIYPFQGRLNQELNTDSTHEVYTKIFYKKLTL